MLPNIRIASPTDQVAVVRVVNGWWGGRQMAGLLQPLFLEHFSGTSLVAEDADGRLAGFLIGFVSADNPTEAYVHFAGVAPECRGSGLGRELYERFDALVGVRGVRVVRCVTSAVNTESVGFHEAIGFVVDGTKPDSAIDGGEYVQLSRPVAPPMSPSRGSATWPPPPHIVLRGEFVEVRPTVLDDAGGLFAALNDPRVWTHLSVPQPQSADDMRGLVETFMSTMRPWTIRLVHPLCGLPPGAVVGWSSFLEVAVPHARLEVGSTAYAPAVWGSVVNPETKLLLLGYAFETLGFGRVQLKTDVRNVRSQDAIARLAATREGVLRRYQRRLDGSVRDTVVFSVTDDEWPGVRSGLQGRLTQPPR